MAENNIYSPEDIEKIRTKMAEKKREKSKSDADNAYDGHIVFEDEMDEIKNNSAASEATDSNSAEEPPVEVNLQKNVLIDRINPPNSPKGQEQGADGISRDVF